MRWVRWVGLGFAVAALLEPSFARAAEAAPPTYALSWVRAEGAEECPNGRALMSEVERRLGRPVFDASAERAFEVEVTRFGSTYRSDVFVRDAAGHALGHRTLQSDEPGCAALLSATALAIALVIDPEAATRDAPPAQSRVAFEPIAPPPAAPAVAPPPVTPAPPVLAPVVEAPPPSDTVVRLSLRGEISGGLVPAVSAGPELAFGVRPSEHWGFELGASFTASQEASRGVGILGASLSRAVTLVTWENALTDNTRLILGVGPALGVLHIAVREPAPVTDPGDFWFLALQGQLGLQMAVTKRVFVEWGGSLFVPLRRQQFLARGQAEPVWREPSVAGRGFLGFGAHFP
ncbi:MAG TPA: hypothetical protein VEQ58_03805 [Polyangiaceae bacterium]|nr:hypothetical protein [Polyangiaceae bacterium]